MQETEDLEARVQHCVACDVASPATQTNYTLISARYGWRLTRGSRDDGTRFVEWFCPRCWELTRESRRSGQHMGSQAV